MGFYQPETDRPPLPSFSQRTRGPAAWGGIGCIMAILLPVLAYFASLVTLEYNAHYHWITIPPNMQARPAGLPVSWAIFILTVGYLILFYAIYATLYALLYRMLGISPYTALDLERPERRRRRKKQNFGLLLGVLGFLLAFLGGIFLVQLNLSQGWVPIPDSWKVPGPVPYAGVYLFAVIALWALLWASWGIFQGLLVMFSQSRDKDKEQERR
ncbi:MAG: hypothetical protein GXO56_05755 [Chloroflexi bacterium]|nr:hypothetical protein [Chloroflexota bacterium]